MNCKRVYDLTDCTEFRQTLLAQPPRIVRGTIVLLVGLITAAVVWSAMTEADLVVPGVRADSTDDADVAVARRGGGGKSDQSAPRRPSPRDPRPRRRPRQPGGICSFALTSSGSTTTSPNSIAASRRSPAELQRIDQKETAAPAEFRGRPGRRRKRS